MTNDPIDNTFVTSIDKTTAITSNFIDRVTSGYDPTYISRDQLSAQLDRQDAIGTFNIYGAYEPLAQSQDLNFKLRSTDLAPSLNMQALRPDVFSYANSIYGGMGIKPPDLQTFAGDLGGSLFSIRIAPLSDRYLDNPTPSMSALGGGTTSNLIGQSGLESTLMELKTNLMTDYGIKIEVNRITSLNSSSPTQLSVTVPDIEINYDGQLITQEGDRNLLRTKSKTFQFTTTEFGGVIELPTNRYIGQSLLYKADGTTRTQSAFETTAGFVATYVLQQQIILDQGTSLAFRQFLTNQQKLNPTQNYLELDKFLGKVLGGEGAFSKQIGAMVNTATTQDFLLIQNQLREKLGVGLDPTRFSQVSGQELAQVQMTTIERILAPLGKVPDRQAASQMFIQNLARELLSPQLIKQADQNTIRVDAFLALKRQILANSGAGNAMLQDQINSMLRRQLSTGRTNLLEQLRSPFLQPHESNFSGSQQLGRRAFFAEDRSQLTRADGAAKIMQLGGVYSHGGRGFEPGTVYTPISAQASANKAFSNQYHDAQLSSVSKDTASFYDLTILFDGARQLNTSTLADLANELGGYNSKEEWLTQLQQQLHVTNQNQQILITPYVKVEQIPQRLKNLTGTRPAIEYSLDFYRDLLNQVDLSQYYHLDREGFMSSLNRGKVVTANLNVVMPKMQYEHAKAKQQELAGTGQDLTEVLRAIEANPHSELRGFVTNNKLKRMLIGTGLNQGSDFIHLNSAHEAVYAYDQHTKIEIEGVKNYNAPGGKLYASNIGMDLQRQVLETAFAPGRAIYYDETKLVHQATINKLTASYNAILSNQAGKSVASMSPGERSALLADRNLRKATAVALQSQYEYLGAVKYDRETDTLNFTLKSGLYGFEDNKVTNYGLFDGDTPRLLLGLAPTINEQGEFVASQQIAVKISGTLRKEQQGVAVTNNQLTFSEIDGRMVGHANYSIIFDGSVRPGVENVKGPGRYDKRELFDYYASRLQGVDYFASARTLENNEIYGIASSASLKGFNYESGLDVLSTDASTQKFLAKLTQNTGTTTALFASYFAEDLSSLMPSTATPEQVAAVKQTSTQLKTAIIKTLGQDAYYQNQLGQVQRTISGKGLAKNANLFVNNSGLFGLVNSQYQSYGMGLNAPSIQLQQTLLAALESGDSSFVKRVADLFEAANLDSTLEKGYRSFNQSSGKVRAASVVSSLLGLTYQALDYSTARTAQAPITGSILELNLIDARTGRINNEVLFGERHLATTSLLYAAKVELPREHLMIKMRKAYQQAQVNGAEFKLDKELTKEYLKLAAQITNVYSASQSMIPLQMQVFVAPSKILQAAGSKDSANLEYHYSIAMSKQQVDKLRGYVSDPNELTEITAAYRMLVEFTQSKSTSNVKFMSPFLGSEATAVHRTAVASLEYAGTLATDLKNYGAGRNRGIFSDYAQAAIANDVEGMRRITTGISALESTSRMYLGTSDLDLTKRAIALSIASDTRRGTLLQGQGRNPYQASATVFFDLETSGLVDKRFPSRDARMYPTQSINELTFIFGTAKDARVIAWREEDAGAGEFKTRAAALNEVSRLLRTTYKDAALVGHNLRNFDIPTLNPLLPGVDLDQRAIIDTLHDVDRIRTKVELGTPEYSLPVAYKAVMRKLLEAMGNDPEAQRKLASDDYGIYQAHEATADVRANIELYQFLESNNLFKVKGVGVDVAAIGKGLLLASGNVTYFDAANNSALSRAAITLAGDIYANTGSQHLGYYYQANRQRYINSAAKIATSWGLDSDILFNYTEDLLFKGMSQSGKLALGKGIENTPEAISHYLYRVAVESDAQVRSAIANTLKSNAGTYIDNITSQALAYKDRAVSLAVKGDTAGAARANKFYSTLYESKMLIMPELNIGQRNTRGNYQASLVAAPPDSQGNQRALLGQSLIYLGADILSHLPKEFGDFVPQIINHRRELDRIIPAYFDVVEKIQKGYSEISPLDRAVVQDMETLAAANRDLVYQALGGALKQRAFGEKTKVSGISGTAVASYLLQIDEVGLGSRFTNVLNQQALRRIAAATGLEFGAEEVLVLRAGGPSGASQLDQSHKIVSIKQLNQAAEQMGTLTQLDPARNRTTSVMPIYGRFSTQGGDFDGDSYGIIGKDNQQLEMYADLLEQNKQLKSVEHSLKRRIGRSKDFYVESYATRQYDRLLTAELDRQAIYEARQTEVSTQLSKALTTGVIDSTRMFDSIWSLIGTSQTKMTKAEYLKIVKGGFTLEVEGASRSLRGQVAEYLRRQAIALGQHLQQKGKLDPGAGGAVDFMQGLSSKTTTEIEAEFLRQQGSKGAEKVAAFKQQAQAQANQAYENMLATMDEAEVDASELGFLRSQLTTVRADLQILKGQLAEKRLGIADLMTRSDELAQKSIAGIRRHVAAYTGLPMSALSKESAVFSDAAVFNMIEQHRGVTPFLEDISPSLVRGGDLSNPAAKADHHFNLLINETLARINERYILPAHQIGTQLQFFNALGGKSSKLSMHLTQTLGIRGSSADAVLAGEYLNRVGTSVETYLGKMVDGRVKQALTDTIAGVGMAAFLDYTPTERFNKVLDYSVQSEAVEGAMGTIRKIINNAGGTTLSNTQFDALQKTIGSTATNLIGEAYNAITLLSNKTIVARSISEALSSNSLIDSGITGTGGEGFLQTTKANFDQRFRSGVTWEHHPDAKQLDQARDLLVQVFDNPQAFTRASFDRAQALTGSLANVQQSIRDSLKQKVDGGLLQSIMAEPVVGQNTIYQILTSDTATEDERSTSLRKFLAEDASASIFNLPKERGYSERYKITAFGSLFLLSDYLSLDSGAQAERMIGLNSTNQHDETKVQSYGFLKERYDTIAAAAQMGDQRAAQMLDADHFIAQSVVDLMAMSMAERTATQSAFKGDGQMQPGALEAMVRQRQLTMVGFKTKTEYGFTPQAVTLAHAEYMLNPGGTRTDYQKDIAASLFFDADTGKDLLKTEVDKVNAARSLGLDQIVDGATFTKYEFEFYQRATTNFLYTRNKEFGPQVRDIQEMRDTSKAIRYLRFESLEGNTTFQHFTQASVGAIEALAIQSTRDQMTDAHQIASMSYTAGQQLVTALGQVHERLQSVYGDLNFSQENALVPLETMRAYQSAQTMSGIFTKLFEHSNLDPTVQKYATEMFAVSLARKDVQGNSGYQQLAHFLGGMAQMSKTQHALLYSATGLDGLSPEEQTMHKTYLAAVDADKISGNQSFKGNAAVAYLTQLGADDTPVAAPTIAMISKDAATAMKKQARTTLIGALIGPALMTLLANAKGDDNLFEHALGGIQSIAQVTQGHEPGAWNAARLFQADRIKNSIRSEGALIGSIRGVTSELMFEAAGRFAHQALGSHKGSGRNYLAEVAISTVALIASSALSGREYGAQQEEQETGTQQALISLPGMGIGIAEHALEEFLRASVIETDSDLEIEYNVSLETQEASINQAFSSGWANRTDSDLSQDEREDSTAMQYDTNSLF